MRDLDEEALAHFGAAVIQQQRAVGVNVKQTACLIEVRRGERDAELDRRQRDPSLEIRAGPVEGADLLAPRIILGALLQIGDDVVDHVVDDRLSVMCDISIVNAIEIDLAHRERIAAEVMRDVVDNGLDADHALWPAEAAERGV